MKEENILAVSCFIVFHHRQPLFASYNISYPKKGVSGWELELECKISENSVIQAAWVWRSRGEAAKRPSRKSWKQRTNMYMSPFLLNVFFSKRFIHAKVMHRGTSKVVSVATTNAKDLRYLLKSLADYNACNVIGNLIAERSIEADVFAMAYEPRETSESRAGLELSLTPSKRMVS